MKRKNIDFFVYSYISYQKQSQLRFRYANETSVSCIMSETELS